MRIASQPNASMHRRPGPASAHAPALPRPAVDELHACQIDDDLVLAGRGRRYDGACQIKLAAQRSGNLTVASAGSHIHAEHVGVFLRQQQGGVLTQRLAHQLHQNSTPHARACPVQARSRARHLDDNAIESINARLRRAVNARGQFPAEHAGRSSACTSRS